MPAKTTNETMPTVLARAQMELGKAVKSADNPYFKSKYAGLDEVIEACRNVLNKHGIAVTQPVEYTPEVTKPPEGGGVMPLEYKKADMQSLGSALTYARRYSLQAICCLATDEPDDDGNKAVGDDNVAAKVNKRSNYRRKPEPQKTHVTTSDDFLPQGKV